MTLICTVELDEEQAMYDQSQIGILHWIVELGRVDIVRSSQVPFLMCTLEIPQKFAAEVLALKVLLFLHFELPSQTELLSNYELFMYFWFCFFFHSYGSFNHANLTSLSFSEFSELFIFILLLSQLIESHFALSSARCHV